MRLLMARDELKLLEMGQRIARLREEHGYKQQWIADQIGVTLRTYQFWQAGDSAPEQENLQKLAELFGVSPKYILNGETPSSISSRGDELDRLEAQVRMLTEQIEAMRLELAGNVLEVLTRLDAIQPQQPAARRRRTA